MSNDFLPANYEQPKNSTAYMKLDVGKHRLRIVSKPVIGWVDWKDNKPIRFKMEDKPEAPVDPKKPVRHFWAMAAWNYKTKHIEILEVTQATIQASIIGLSKNEDWGSPTGYDLEIERTGTDQLSTKYTVTPVPPKPVSKEITEALLKVEINLDELFKNAEENRIGGDKK